MAKKICKKCGGYLGGTHNGPPTCIHGVSMKKHCCECGAWSQEKKANG